MAQNSGFEVKIFVNCDTIKHAKNLGLNLTINGTS